MRRQLNRVIREGRVETHVVTIAARVALRRELREVVRVEIVRGRFDLDRCFLDREVRGTEKVLASAPVPREAASRAAKTLLDGARVPGVGP